MTNFWPAAAAEKGDKTKNADAAVAENATGEESGEEQGGVDAPDGGAKNGAKNGPRGDSANGEAGSKPDDGKANKEERNENFEVMLKLARNDERAAGNRVETKQNYESALQTYQQILNAGAAGRYAAEANFGKGRCLYYLERNWEAFQALERSFPEKLEPEGVQQRIEVEYDLAKRLRRLGDRPVPGAEQEPGGAPNGNAAAARVLLAVVYNDPRCPEAAQSLLAAADCLTAAGETGKAEQTCRRLIDEHGDKLEGYEARALLAKVLLSGKFRGEMPKETAEEIDRLFAQCRASGFEEESLQERMRAAVLQSQERKAQSLLSEAEFYVRKGKSGSKSATFLLRDVVRLYPETKSAAEAKKLLEKMRVIENDKANGEADEPKPQ